MSSESKVTEQLQAVEKDIEALLAQYRLLNAAREELMQTLNFFKVGRNPLKRKQMMDVLALLDSEEEMVNPSPK